MVKDLKKKYVVLAMASCLSLMVFTGCGNKNDNDSVTASPAAEETTASPEATDNVLDDMEDGVDDVIDGTEDAVDDAVDGAEDAVDDVTGNDTGNNADTDQKQDKDKDKNNNNNNSVTDGKDAGKTNKK